MEIKEIEKQIDQTTEGIQNLLWSYMDNDEQAYEEVCDIIDELKDLVEMKIRIEKNKE